MKKVMEGKRRYITGFDGLRALAVIGVITFHLWPGVMAGGWLGVPLFFVLSGYLITDILIQEFDRTGKIKIGAFWLRRIKRLYPALIVMLLATSTMIVLYFRPLLYSLRAILLTNLTYVYNLWATANGDSYFDQWGGSSPFTHLWSLSIEGQFYLFWPLIVAIVLKMKFKRQKIAIGILIASLISALLMAIFYSPENINRVYYGTDTRLFAILIGTALAFIWPAKKLRIKVRTAVKQRMNLIGWVTLGLLGLSFIWLNGQQPVTYFGGMYVVTILMGVIVAITAHPASTFSTLLNQKFLNYLGTRSYSIYLYQLPVFVFSDKLIGHQDGLLINLIKIGLVIGLAEISYRFVEQMFKRFKNTQFILTRSSRVYAFLALILLMGTTQAVITKQSAEAKPLTSLEKRLKANKDKMAKANKSALKAQKNEQSSSASKTDEQKQTYDNPTAQKFGISDQEFNQISGMDFSAVGDSLLLNAAPNLQEVMPKMVINAEIGRQTQVAADIITGMAQNQTLANNVLVVIGTNGAVKPEMINQVMTATGQKRQVYWVNAYADRPWIGSNDANLNDATKRFNNLHVIDWNDVARQHADWLGPDQVHPSPNGSIEYTKLIAQAILKNNQN
ncbi:MAG: acetyltransferase [Lactobacillaceae bacterium]|jgi:peptidoglycan/LPS O-acetylase OafA/YrhL|nr:acetyltransferase [Lactobacillaceae bacterium]